MPSPAAPLSHTTPHPHGTPGGRAGRTRILLRGQRNRRHRRAAAAKQAVAQQGNQDLLPRRYILYEPTYRATLETHFTCLAPIPPPICQPVPPISAAGSRAQVPPRPVSVRPLPPVHRALPPHVCGRPGKPLARLDEGRGSDVQAPQRPLPRPPGPPLLCRCTYPRRLACASATTTASTPSSSPSTRSYTPRYAQSVRLESPATPHIQAPQHTAGREARLERVRASDPSPGRPRRGEHPKQRPAPDAFLYQQCRRLTASFSPYPFVHPGAGGGSAAGPVLPARGRGALPPGPLHPRGPFEPVHNVREPHSQRRRRRRRRRRLRLRVREGELEGAGTGTGTGTRAWTTAARRHPDAPISSLGRCQGEGSERSSCSVWEGEDAPAMAQVLPEPSYISSDSNTGMGVGKTGEAGEKAEKRTTTVGATATTAATATTTTTTRQ